MIWTSLFEKDLILLLLLMRDERLNCSEQPKIGEVEKKPITPKREKGINLINLKEIEKEVAREIMKGSLNPIFSAVSLVITEFSDVFSKGLLDQLPPTRNIQHAIDLISRTNQLNLPH